MKLKNEYHGYGSYSRKWINETLMTYAPHFTGEVCNVSGAQDKDKTGSYYKNYFPNASAYYISNYGDYAGINDAGFFLFDLEASLPGELSKRFDTVLNISTLEHVFDCKKALENICNMARKAVILVVPFIEYYHALEGEYEDYWRFSPTCLDKMLRENGFVPITIACFNEKNKAVNFLIIGVRGSCQAEYEGIRNIDKGNVIGSLDRIPGNWLVGYSILYRAMAKLRRISSKFGWKK